MRALKLAALFAWMLIGAAASPIPARLTVVIFDYANVPRTVPSRGQAGAPRVSAGGSGDRMDPLQSRRRLLCTGALRAGQDPVVRPLRTTPVSAYSLGSTITCNATEHCAASYVFYNRILTFSDDTSSPQDISLAYVMVHEIGHLHGPGAPSQRGIMTTAFTAHDLHQAASGWFDFADDDARELSRCGRLRQRQRNE